MNVKVAFAAGLLVSITTLAKADLVVVANPSVHFSSLSQAALTRLFLGQSNSFPDGSIAQPLDSGVGQRNTFYESALKRPPDQIEKYWTRMIFTGKALPPREIRANEVRAVVAETPGSISYIDRSQVDSSVKVITITP